VTFGEALKKARGKMPQTALAKAIKVDPSALSQVERGIRNTLSAETVSAIESALGIKPGALSKYLPAGHRAHDVRGTTIPDMGLVWGSPPRDVPEPVPGKVYHLVGRFPADTFALTVSGHSVHRYGVHEGDVIAVQPCSEPEDGALIIARQGNAYTVKGCQGGRLFSFGKNDETPQELDVSEPLEVVGVMLGVIDGQRRFVPRSKTRGVPPKKK
jgi:SOS-response transcriptional repressor LexA